jgi:uncharacterized membrane protein HdeD (DUF308 family)
VDRFWFYILTAIVSATVGAILMEALRHKPGRFRVAAWLSIIFGGLSFLLYALRVSPEVFTLVLGIVCVTSGAHTLESSRLEERIKTLESEIRSLRSERAAEEALR